MLNQFLAHVKGSFKFPIESTGDHFQQWIFVFWMMNIIYIMVVLMYEIWAAQTMEIVTFKEVYIFSSFWLLFLPSLYLSVNKIKENAKS